MELVRDIMEPDVLCLSPDTPLEEAARVLSERQVGGAPVRTGDGRVVGIVSRTDVIESFGRAGVARTVRDVMTPEVLSVMSDSPVEVAIRLMAFEGVHRLVVFDDQGRLAGIVTTMDVLRHLAGFARREQRAEAIAPPEL